jgi:uncharacterized membrane protein
MAPRLKNARTAQAADKPYYLASIVLSLLGAADAIYLIVLKYTHAPEMCLGNGGCETVNSSAYSQIGIVPVSVIGLLGYLALLGVHFLEPRSAIFRRNGPLFTFGMSLTGVIFSAYLTWIEFYVIHAVCPFCVASAVIITLVFAIAIIRLVKQLASQEE